MVIAIDIDQFVSIKQTLVNLFIELANRFKQSSTINFSSRNILIKNLTSSSTIVQGAISADSSSVQAISSGLDTSLASQPSVGGFSVINTQITVVSDVPAVDDNSSENDSSKLGLILGVSIPFLILSNFQSNI